jgi:uncharacterized membrane protein HdeD (DUF308 family)
MVMVQTKSSKWNLVAGIVMLFLGGVIWVNPLDTMLALAFYIGLGFVIAGIFYILASMNIKSGWYLLVGVLDLLVGGILMANLGVTAASLPVIVALWCLTVGVIQIIGAFEIKRYGLPWGWSGLMGILGIVFGLIILAYPIIGAVTISTVVGLYAVMFGLLQLAEYQMSKNTYRLVINN